MINGIVVTNIADETDLFVFCNITKGTDVTVMTNGTVGASLFVFCNVPKRTNVTNVTNNGAVVTGLFVFCNVPKETVGTNGTVGTKDFPVTRERWDRRAFSLCGVGR